MGAGGCSHCGGCLRRAGHQGVGLLGLKQKAAIRGGAGTGYQKAIGKCAREALPAATPGEGRGATHRRGGLCRPLAEKWKGVCSFTHSLLLNAAMLEGLRCSAATRRVWTVLLPGCGTALKRRACGLLLQASTGWTERSCRVHSQRKGSSGIRRLVESHTPAAWKGKLQTAAGPGSASALNPN